MEWLLVMAAVGSFAAVMAFAIQQILDDAAETPTDPAVRLLEASVTAAALSSEAAPTRDGSGPQPGEPLFADLRQRCEQISELYPNAVASSEWVSVSVDAYAPVPDITLPPDTTIPDTTPPLQELWVCQVTSRRA